jgi:hypothetical protein
MSAPKIFSFGASVGQQGAVPENPTVESGADEIECTRTILDPLTGLAWHDADHVCALSDNERHLGHAVKLHQWHAYDATRPEPDGDGFTFLGAFPERRQAKEAVQQSVRALMGPDSPKILQ